MDQKRFYFEKDNDGHLYMLPVELADLFFDLLENDPDGYDPRWSEVETYRCNRPLACYSFTDPREDT